MTSGYELLGAYHDGELGWLGRRRVERWLTRDPAARRELEMLAGLGHVLREAASEAPASDLWGEIAGRLRAIDATLEAPDPAPSFLRARFAGWLRPAALGALLTAGVAGIVLLLSPGEPATTGVVRWLDTQGKAVLVLDGPGEATIIWFLEPTQDSVELRGNHREII